MRVSLEGKGQAVDGDVTTTGAICIATGAGYLDEGRMVLREGDQTTPCPLCGQVGMVAEGVDHFISDGQRVAMDGALVVCGCSPGSNRVVAPLYQAPPPMQPVAGLANAHFAEPSNAVYPERFSQPVIGALPGTLEPGFYVVPRRMSFPEVLLHLAEHDATLPISRLQRLNPTFEQGFKAGEIFVIGDPDNGDACTREEGELMAAAQHARRALAVLDYAEADFMMEHQAEIAGLLSNASLSMGVGKDMLDQGLKQVSHTLTSIEQLHQREFMRHGHLNSPGFFAERRRLLQQLDGQLKTAFLNKQLNLGNYERLRKSLNISTKSLVHHWSKAGGPGQIPGYATHLDKVAKLGRYLKHGGHVAIGLGGTSSYLKVKEACQAGETEACKVVRLKEAGSFSGGVVGGAAGGFITGLAATSICGVFAIGTAGIGAPICGIAVVGTGSLAGSVAGEAVGEMVGEKIYESIAD
ncbi:PAAR domain-containing protein [Pseudomonas sp. FYR_2]|uniref:PAAR domain-containing protein n=2 Tax=Pseudomonas TaxID=286 RepID=A0A6G6UWN0_9PSED|nr:MULTISPECIES: PAAR domain-containing protein [Pseudomonas]MBA6137724.1 PAAR domain-containing protein [Pseudomonas monteilii]MCE0911436.1 PAAR domain-containing protein [Pseudomonas kurunegalensis]MDT3747181.1 PAAR domain-containing protein [Pseudomonas kurunegalensis]MVF49076.1 PAAR domain-containing protein [Pseudomonas monteilii]QIG17696.1 PAAR domain-containing protein [Pseudomonas monteilii]